MHTPRTSHADSLLQCTLRHGLAAADDADLEHQRSPCRENVRA